MTSLAILVIAAIRYPGGTWTDPSTQGYAFWGNFLCDLSRPVALNGQPNPVGQVLGPVSHVVLAIGLAVLWRSLPRLLPKPSSLGAWISGAGTLSAVALVMVPFTPGSRITWLHPIAAYASAVPGIFAALASIRGLWSSGPTERLLSMLGVAMVIVALANGALYTIQITTDVPPILWIPVLERIVAMMFFVWIVGIAWRLRVAPQRDAAPA